MAYKDLYSAGAFLTSIEEECYLDMGDDVEVVPFTLCDVAPTEATRPVRGAIYITNHSIEISLGRYRGVLVVQDGETAISVFDGDVLPERKVVLHGNSGARPG